MSYSGKMSLTVNGVEEIRSIKYVQGHNSIESEEGLGGPVKTLDKHTSFRIDDSFYNTLCYD